MLSNAPFYKDWKLIHHPKRQMDSQELEKRFENVYTPQQICQLIIDDIRRQFGTEPYSNGKGLAAVQNLIADSECQIAFLKEYQKDLENEFFLRKPIENSNYVSWPSKGSYTLNPFAAAQGNLALAEQALEQLKLEFQEAQNNNLNDYQLWQFLYKSDYAFGGQNIRMTLALSHTNYCVVEKVSALALEKTANVMDCKVKTVSNINADPSMDPIVEKSLKSITWPNIKAEWPTFRGHWRQFLDTNKAFEKTLAKEAKRLESSSGAPRATPVRKLVSKTQSTSLTVVEEDKLEPKADLLGSAQGWLEESLKGLLPEETGWAGEFGHFGGEKLPADIGSQLPAVSDNWVYSDSTSLGPERKAKRSAQVTDNPEEQPPMKLAKPSCDDGDLAKLFDIDLPSASFRDSDQTLPAGSLYPPLLDVSRQSFRLTATAGSLQEPSSFSFSPKRARLMVAETTNGPGSIASGLTESGITLPAIAQNQTAFINAEPSSPPAALRLRQVEESDGAPEQPNLMRIEPPPLMQSPTGRQLSPKRVLSRPPSPRGMATIVIPVDLLPVNITLTIGSVTLACLVSFSYGYAWVYKAREFLKKIREIFKNKK